MGYLETSAEVAAEAFVEWQRSLSTNMGASFSIGEVDGPLSAILEAALPITSPSSRFLFIPTGSAWTAFTQNSFQGADTGPIAILAEDLGIRTVRIATVPDTDRVEGARPRGRYGACIFELYGGEVRDNSNNERTVSLMDEGGTWSFHTSGSPLPFEDTKRYRRRRVRERFDFDLLDEYLQQLGIWAFDEGFYRSPGVLVERHSDRGDNIEELALEDLRATW